ncbi:hypothetical protein Tco_1313431 [Tanacetum coccineum]
MDVNDRVLHGEGNLECRVEGERELLSGGLPSELPDLSDEPLIKFYEEEFGNLRIMIKELVEWKVHHFEETEASYSDGCTRTNKSVAEHTSTQGRKKWSKEESHLPILFD